MKKRKENLTEEERVVKNFRIVRKILNFILCFCLAIPIVLIVIAFASIAFLVGDTANNNFSEIDESIIYDQVEIFEDDSNNIRDFGNEQINNIATVISSTTYMVNFIFTLVILNYLSKICLEVENKKTPFTENNIKYISKISIFSIILCVVRIISVCVTTEETGVGLIFVAIILIISSIFKYGYKLQQESDETL